MTKGWRSLVLLVMLLPLLAVGAAPVLSQTSQPAMLDVITTSSIDFPNGIEFSASIEMPSSDPVAGIDLYYRAGPQETWHLAVVPFSRIDQQSTTLNATVTVDFRTDFLPAGVDLTVFWRITATSGSSQDTSETRISWVDPRFDWQTTATPQVTVHFYDLGDDTSNLIAATAQHTVDDLELRYSLAESQPISIWIYRSYTDFQATTPQNSREAVAGVSYPDYLLIHAIIPDGSTQEIGRTITHEISHQVLNQALANPYGPPPLWFDEGMATHAQIAGTSGYLPLAIRAATTNQLFRLDSLDSGFPFQAGKASIAYAESWAAVEYIGNTWGDDGIGRLIAALGEGLPVNDALQRALGIDLAQLNDGLVTWLLSQATLPATPQSGVQS